MNRLITTICVVSFTLLMGCKRDQSCVSMDYSYILPSNFAQETVYIKLYASEDDFVNGEKGVEAVESAGELYLRLPVQEQSIPFLDIRYGNGANSWSNQSQLAQVSKTTVSSANCETMVRFLDIASLQNSIQSSPIYMYLTLADHTQDGGSKAWAIDKIYDEDEVDVSERPEWQCVKKIGFTFFKGGKGAKVKVTRATGESVCGMYDEFFGDRDEVFATYSLEGSDQKELRITVPAASDVLKELMTFTIVEADYDHLKISLTNGDTQVGYAVLIPFTHE